MQPNNAVDNDLKSWLAADQAYEDFPGAPMDIAIEVVPAGRTGGDRAGAFPRPDGHLLVLADGAGGTSGASLAADAVVAGARARSLNSTADCVGLLRDLDEQLANVGQTTAVVVVLSAGWLFGASVGDSGAWLVDNSEITDLTERQKPKPLLGSGRAVPIGFGPTALAGRVLIGSDGLFKYVARDRIRDLVSNLSVAEVPAALVDSAKLRSGTLQDDIAVVVAGQERKTRWGSVVMQQPEVDTKALRRNVESDFLRYAAQYQAPEKGDTLGVPWTKEELEAEVEKMARLLVDPYSVSYLSSDDLRPIDERLVGERHAYVVAEDDHYVLLYDIGADDFVLAHRRESGQLTAWGIRGDAASTFLAR